ncbi:MAG: L-threonylcarbamoyladenylate synthase [Actinomycetota bacterium]
MIVSLSKQRDEAIGRASEALRMGDLVVAPTDTIYGLLADAFKPWALKRIFELKKRPRSLPLPILVSRPKMAWALCGTVPDAALNLAAAFWPGALTLILPENPDLDAWDLGESKGTIAFRMPAHADLIEILGNVGPVAGTSANLTGTPTPRTIGPIREAFGEEVKVYVDGGKSKEETGSTIVDLTGEELKILREGPISSADVHKAAAGWNPAEE